MQKPIKRGCLGLTAALLLLVVGFLIFVWFQGQRTPSDRPEYVALGSSFAAGAGLGPLQKGSPLLCARTINGYPEQLARMRNLSIVDMSCGGAVTKDLLRGGQYFQGPQIRTVTTETRLVTITIGGNDTLYIADLSQLAARNSNSLWGKLVRQFWGGPKSRSERNFDGLKHELVALLRAIHAQAPNAKIVVATYPTILPQNGTCPQLGLTASEADAMRTAADQLAATTRSAAEEGGAILVDMHSIGAAHHACSANPWTYGWSNAGAAPFHPTLAGAGATAEAISQTLDHQQL